MSYQTLRSVPTESTVPRRVRVIQTRHLTGVRAVLHIVESVRLSTSPVGSSDEFNVKAVFSAGVHVGGDLRVSHLQLAPGLLQRVPQLCYVLASITARG